MKYSVQYTKKATRDLEKLPEKTAQRIAGKIKFFRQQPDPLHYAKKLNNNDSGEYRFRIGEYRAIFDVGTNGRLYILMILRIKHRKDIYHL